MTTYIWCSVKNIKIVRKKEGRKVKREREKEKGRKEKGETEREN